MSCSRLEKYVLDFKDKKVEIGILKHDTITGKVRYEVYEKVNWKHNIFPCIFEIQEAEKPYTIYFKIRETYDKLFDKEYHG